jgi:hypothetical protein
MSEDEVLSALVANTQSEIFQAALNHDDDLDGTDTRADAEHETDTSLEEMEDILDEDVPEEVEEGDDEAGEEGAPDEPAAEVPATDEEEPEPQARFPSGRLREEALRRHAVEQERDTLRAQVAAFQAHLLTQQQQQKPPQQEAPQPDIWSDPEAWAANQRAQITHELTSRHVNAALAEAHEEHGDEFVAAYKTLTSLNPGDPMARAVVQRIWDAPNPGKSLMRWYGEQKILRESAGDPAAYRQRVAREIMSDPEFRRQILSDMRGEATRADGGRPRTSTRLPKSLNGASGSGSMHASNPDLYDGSDKSIFAFAMRP